MPDLLPKQSLRRAFRITLSHGKAALFNEWSAQPYQPEGIWAPRDFFTDSTFAHGYTDHMVGREMRD
jgi:hypothetical protein